MSGKWKLVLYDAFEGKDYELDGEYIDEAGAIEAASARSTRLEGSEPSSLQDRIYILNPDGGRRLYLHIPPEVLAILESLKTGKK